MVVCTAAGRRPHHPPHSDRKQWDGSNEDEFGEEVEKMRGLMREYFDHILHNPRTIEDIGGTGKDQFDEAPLWLGGPTWNSLPGLARPSRPADDALTANRSKI